MNPQAILKEFAKGCSCGAPGECDPCLKGAVSALENYFNNNQILIEDRKRVGQLETIERIYKE